MDTTARITTQQNNYIQSVIYQTHNVILKKNDLDTYET